MTSTNPELDHYMVLGVEREATQDQIDEAYELAKTDRHRRRRDGPGQSR